MSAANDSSDLLCSGLTTTSFTEQHRMLRDTRICHPRSQTLSVALAMMFGPPSTTATFLGTDFQMPRPQMRVASRM